jgi:hypothetical protein
MADDIRRVELSAADWSRVVRVLDNSARSLAGSGLGQRYADLADRIVTQLGDASTTNDGPGTAV